MKTLKFITALFIITAGVAVAKPAPAFTLKDTNGKTHSLSDFKGKVVVLEWLNHDCPFVKKHYNSGNMQTLQKKYTGKDVVWLSIVSSAPGKQGHYSPSKANKLTADKGAAPTAVLIDSDGKTGRAYGAKRTPEMVIIDTEGNHVFQGAIDSNAGFDEAEIKSAKNYVAQNLDALLAGKKLPVSSNKAYGCGIKYP